MPSRTSLDSSAPIMAPSNVRPRSQFNLYPSTTTTTTTPVGAASPPPAYSSTPASPQQGFASAPRNFSRPQAQPKPMADILSQSSVAPTPPQSKRTSIFGTQMPAAQPLGSNLKRTESTESRQTLSSEFSQREIKRIEDGLDKLENKKLGQQRYIPSATKETDMSALKLGAKLERALDRRLGGQDAVMRPRGQTLQDSEKQQIAA